MALITDCCWKWGREGGLTAVGWSSIRCRLDVHGLHESIGWAAIDSRFPCAALSGSPETVDRGAALCQPDRKAPERLAEDGIAEKIVTAVPRIPDLFAMAAQSRDSRGGRDGDRKKEDGKIGVR